MNSLGFLIAKQTGDFEGEHREQQGVRVEEIEIRNEETTWC